MRCEKCSTEYEFSSAVCPVCGEPAPQTKLRQRMFSNRPLGYPNPFVWLRAGVMRDWRGPVGAFVATWLYVPLALLFAAWSALVLGIGGLIVGGTGLDDLVPEAFRSAPLVGPMIDSFLSRSGGALAAAAGFGIGLVGGFLAGLLLPWRDTVDDPAKAAGAVLGVVAAAALIGLVYTLYRVVLEGRLLHVSGARRPSRREADFLVPILHESARRLELPNVPRLLVDDRPGMNAYAYTRHVVISSDLVEEFDYQSGPVAAVLSHELVHWRNGDPVTATFVRGVALPLYLVHAAASWLIRTFPHPVIRFIVVAVFWPILVTVKYVVMPLQALDTRQAEYRADGGAVLTGHLVDLRAVLGARKRSFEAGRSGWEEAVCATHPPYELRLERLEAPGVRYLVTGEEQTVGPLPAPDAELTDRSSVLPPPGSLGSKKGWAAVGAVALACCLLLGALAVVQWRLYTPQSAIEDYFAALQRHDGDAAVDLVSIEDVDRPALAKMIEGTEYRPPTGLKVTRVTMDGDRAAAEVSYRLGETTRTEQLSLRRNDKTSALVFHGWQIEGGVSAFAVNTSGPTMRVNGVETQIDANSAPTVTALPGGYVVSVPDNPLTEARPVTVYLGMGGAEALEPVDLQPTVKPAARQRTTELVKEYLDRCATQQVATPEGCPFSYYRSSVVGEVRWQIRSYPELEIVPEGPLQARVSTEESGAGLIRVSGRTDDFVGGTDPFSEDVEVGVFGIVTVEGTDLVFQPQAD